VAREARNLTLSEVADRAGIPLSTLSSIRHGRRKGGNLTLDQATRLALALGISLDWLVGRWIDAADDSSPPVLDALLQLPGPEGFEQLVTQRVQEALAQIFADMRDVPEYTTHAIATTDRSPHDRGHPSREPGTDERRGVSRS
jgi:transcriptional regulator with XRE-family HTH domain